MKAEYYYENQSQWLQLRRGDGEADGSAISPAQAEYYFPHADVYGGARRA